MYRPLTDHLPTAFFKVQLVQYFPLNLCPVLKHVLEEAFFQSLFSVFTFSQMKVLDYGLIAAAKEIQEVAHAALKSASESESEGHKKDQEACMRAVDEHTKNALHDLDKKEAKRKSVVKSVTDFRHSVVKDFLKTHMINKKRYCPYCTAPSRDVRSEYNSRIFLKALSTREAQKWAATKVVHDQQKKREKDNNEDDSDSEQEDWDNATPEAKGVWF